MNSNAGNVADIQLSYLVMIVKYVSGGNLFNGDSAPCRQSWRLDCIKFIGRMLKSTDCRKNYKEQGYAGIVPCTMMHRCSTVAATHPHQVNSVNTTNQLYHNFSMCNVLYCFSSLAYSP